MNAVQHLKKVFMFGIGVKRWILLLFGGIGMTALGLALGLLKFFLVTETPIAFGIIEILFIFAAGISLVIMAVVGLSGTLLAPYRRHQPGSIVDAVYSHSRRQKGIKVVAIGGGTGLPASLRGLKSVTNNITAVVTVADDGGSSGRLRREMGVLPPGDLRNNIAALADDESLMTRLFQYRFNTGDLNGHAFGNLFISALSGVTGSLETALIETERVLNIQGRVLPSTMTDVNLAAEIYLPSENRTVTVEGESSISDVGGQIQRIWLMPEKVAAYQGAVRAILDADLIVIGPGSLYTSIIPNLLVREITEALRATNAYKVYVCNIAQQPGETDDYTTAEHVFALERHIGRGVFQAVIANNVYLSGEGENRNTRYVLPAPEHHEILQRYDVYYTDLIDVQRPWRHDPEKLGRAIMTMSESERKRVALIKPALATS